MNKKFDKKPVRMRKTRANTKKLPPNPRLRNMAHRPPRPRRALAAANTKANNPLNAVWMNVKRVCFSTKEKLRNTVILSVMVLCVLASIVCGLNYQPQREHVSAAMSSTELENLAPLTYHVTNTFNERDNTFMLQGLDRFSEFEIKRNLSFIPKVNFEVKKLEDGGVLIMPENARNIAYTGSYKFTMEDKSQKTVMFDVNLPALTVQLNEWRIHEYQDVTLSFSEQVDIYSLKQNLRIMPTAEVELYHDLNEVRIMPVNGWRYSDHYTITVDEDYKSAGGKQLESSKSFTVYIEDSNYQKRVNSYIEFKTSGEFLLNPSDSMTMSFYASRLPQAVPVIIDTYRMPSIEKYRDQGHIYLDYDIKLDSLEKLDSNVFLIQNTPENDDRRYYGEFADDGTNKLAVPNQGEGAYILNATYKDPVTGDEKTVRTGYLVTPISVYMQTGARETAVWLNSSAQDAPLAGYEVMFEGMAEPAGKTDERGLLIVPNEKMPKSENYWDAHIPFSITDPDGKLVYYDDAKNMYVSQGNEESYYSYLFLDRTLYKPEDTVCFWGFVKPFRYNTTETPKTAFVRFDPDGLDITIEAEIDESGIFSGEIALERIKSTQYAIRTELRFEEPVAGENQDADGREQDTREENRFVSDMVYALDTEYVSVKEFEKPTFTLSSQTDKNYYAGDDRVNVTVQAAFYDGTPLPNYPLEIAYYDMTIHSWTNLPDIKTDAMGGATFSFPAVSGGESVEGYTFKSNQYKVQIASDGEQITHVGGYSYFPSDILIETSFEEKNGNVSMTARTYRFDTESPALKEYMERVEQEPRYWRWYDERELLKVAKGAPVDVELQLDLRWSYTDQNNIYHWNYGRGYASDGYVRYKNSYSLDAESFKIVEDWETKSKRILVETKDGVAVIDDLIYKRDGNVIDFARPVHINAHFAYKDTKRNTYRSYSNYTNTDDYGYWDRDHEESDEVVKGYSFAITNVTTGNDITPKSIYYDGLAISADNAYRFDVLLDGEPVETNGRIFYTVMQDGIFEHGVTGQNSLNLPYKMEYGRSIRLVAAYFDGTKTHYIKQLDLQAMDESLAVNLEVTPDKAGYRPGDTVSLAVRATDHMGRGVSGNLCIAVVDESIFALAEQEVDALYGIYRRFYSFNNYVSEYCTTYRNENEPGNPVDGGKGDEGGVEFYDSYRSNFKDTALFLPTKTDAAGNSRVTFTLPDNTTSWRITAVEIGSDLRAGQLKSNIISSLPFFVKPVTTSKYIEGDDVSMLVQGHGTLLDDGDDISYTVTLQGDGTDITLTGEGKTGTPLEFNFGKLPIGSYTVISRAQYSGYSDTVELPLSVLKSNLELVVSKPIDPRNINISAVRYPVTITFYDKENEAFFASINSLFGHYCMQANQRLSRFVAKRVVRDTVVNGTVPSYIAEGNDNASDMQNEDGGIAFYPGDRSAPLVTMYVQLVAQDQFNLPLMARYYRDILATNLTDSKTRAACLLGLAAMGNATVDEITTELEKDNLTADVQAYLIAALAYLGETDRAMTLYNQKLASHVAGIDPASRQGEQYEVNAAAIWVAASILHHPDADALSMYFGGANWRYRTLFECMIYVTNYNRQVEMKSFSSTIKGVTRNIDLGFSGMSTMVLSKSEMESFSVNNPPESLRATAYYVGEPTELGLEQSDKMSISKSIRAADDDTYEVTLNIKLANDAPTGYYDISDWVPSNTRLYSHDSSFGTGSNAVYFYTESEGQKLYVSFEYNKNQPKEIIYRYQIRQTFSGPAALDTAYMIHGDSGENCHTEKSEFAPSAMPGRQPAITAN